MKSWSPGTIAGFISIEEPSNSYYTADLQHKYANRNLMRRTRLREAPLCQPLQDFFFPCTALAADDVNEIFFQRDWARVLTDEAGLLAVVFKSDSLAQLIE